jgi:very-short-patch-repair endonuclease
VNHAIDRIASRQNSLITSDQLLAAGWSSRQIALYKKRGALSEIRTHVYRLAGGPITWVQALHAAVLAAGDDAFISGGTGGALWEYRHADREHCGLHVTARHRVRLRGVVGHTATLDPSETTVHLGVPVTTPERTLMDLAGTMSLTALGECLDDALRRRLINLERLRRLTEAASARGGRRLLSPIHRLLAERIPGFDAGGSDWENRMDALWDGLGLEPGARQFRVRVAGHTYIIDRAIPELKIGAEFNGHEFHHRVSDQDRDSQRIAELVAAGWHIIAITAGTRPETMRDAVQRIVEDRRRWLALDRLALDRPANARSRAS